VRSPGRWKTGPATAGTLLVWLALLAPLASPIWVLVQRAFFGLGLAGGGLLLWAALWARVYRQYTGVSLGVAAASCALGRALTGALGTSAPGTALAAGSRGTLTLAGFAIYLLAQIALGVGGIVLMRHSVAARRELLSTSESVTLLGSDEVQWHMTPRMELIRPGSLCAGVFAFRKLSRFRGRGG
jgi:hypothetical protein